ncbi:MAG: arginine--tRNA ligase, partial [Chloroflexota bacterium]
GSSLRTGVTMATDPLRDLDGEIFAFLEAAGVPPGLGQLSTPADREFGERSSNIAFQLAKQWRQSPSQIAAELSARFDPTHYRFIGAVEPAGVGFINFRANYAVFTPHVIAAIREQGDTFGRREAATPARVIVEHTSVNPSKEWHVGHVRNAVLGDVVARVLRLAGLEIEVQNYIDDTGLQAAAAVFGLQAFPEQPMPGEKYDHLVGRAYVKIWAELGAERELRAQLEILAADAPERTSTQARLDNMEKLKTSVLQVMHGLEAGEFHDTMEAILNAQLLTAYRLGIFYDLLNWESHLVRSRLFEQAMMLLEKSPKVYRPSEGRYAGTMVIETEAPTRQDEEVKREVLIRSSGLPTYVAKDIAYHLWKFVLVPDRLGYTEYRIQPNGQALWSTGLETGEGSRNRGTPDQVINLIGVEQTQAQEAVRDALRAASFGDAADHLTHLGYGLVTTAEGRLSGRKGTAAAGDAIIDEAVRVALERVREKRSNDLPDEEMAQIAEAVGVGAVRYFMTQYNPLRAIVFDVADVVSYDGNTALYIQYALVRMFAILRRAQQEHQIASDAIDQGDATMLEHRQERRLIFQMALYPELIATAARTLSVNLVAEYAYDLATIFNQFYRDCGVLNAEASTRLARLLLVRTVRDVLVNVCGVLGVPVIERL